jgi:TrmH family RNA methyltransferase
LYCSTNAEVAFAALVARAEGAGVPVEHLKEGVLEKLGSTVTPQPVLAVAPMPTSTLGDATGEGLVVVGVELADPGNVGTLVRSAEASGASGIVLSTGSVDAYNPKVVRASAGAIFGISVIEGCAAVEALDALGKQGRRRLAADARVGTAYDEVDFGAPTAIVLGNEAKGVPTELDAVLDGRVCVPMHGAADSLNVAMAGTVLCFEAARQRAYRSRT